MESIFTSSPLPISLLSQFSPAYQSRELPRFRTKYRIKIHKISSSKPSRILPVTRNFRTFSFQEPPSSAKEEEEEEEEEVEEEEEKRVLGLTGSSEQQNQSVPLIGNSPIQCIGKYVAYALFCSAVGLYNISPIGNFRAAAIAAPVASELTVDRKDKVKGNDKEKEENTKKNSHEYSDYTRRLLETVSVLLRSIEEARRGTGDIMEVRLALKAVKTKREDLEDEIMRGLHGELRELKTEKEGLEERAEEIVNETVKMRREREKLAAEKELKERLGRLEESLGRMEEEYDGIWERVGEIEDRILRRETVALSIGVRELRFIDRECEELVHGFNLEMRRKELAER